MRRLLSYCIPNPNNAQTYTRVDAAMVIGITFCSSINQYSFQSDKVDRDLSAVLSFFSYLGMAITHGIALYAQVADRRVNELNGLIEEHNAARGNIRNNINQLNRHMQLTLEIRGARIETRPGALLNQVQERPEINNISLDEMRRPRTLFAVSTIGFLLVALFQAVFKLAKLERTAVGLLPPSVLLVVGGSSIVAYCTYRSLGDHMTQLRQTIISDQSFFRAVAEEVNLLNHRFENQSGVGIQAITDIEGRSDVGTQDYDRLIRLSPYI